MNDPICIMLMGVIIGAAIHDPICNFTHSLHDLCWRNKIRSCANCKWSYEYKSFLICDKSSDNVYKFIVPIGGLCEKWETVENDTP